MGLDAVERPEKMTVTEILRIAANTQALARTIGGELVLSEKKLIAFGMRPVQVKGLSGFYHIE